MTEEEKRKHEMEELQKKKIAGYERKKAIGAMTKLLEES